MQQAWRCSQSRAAAGRQPSRRRAPGTPQEESKAIVDDAAGQLGIDSTKLSDALKKALENRVDAAVAAGSITRAEGDALKARIQSQEYPLLGGPGFGRHHGGPGFGHHLGAGPRRTSASPRPSCRRSDSPPARRLPTSRRRRARRSTGSWAALVADEKKELDAAVAAGRLTQAQADELLTNAEQRFTAIVNGTLLRVGRAGSAARRVSSSTAADLGAAA